MVFSRVKANGWATNQKLTSAQANQLDIDHANALDKTGDNSAGGGGISGLVEVLNGGEIDYNSGATLKVKSGATVNCQAGCTTTLAGTNTISGATTITGTTTLSANMTCTTGKTVTINSGATFTCASGSTTNLNGAVAVASTAAITLSSGCSTTFNSGSVLTISTSSANYTISSFPNFVTPKSKTVCQTAANATYLSAGMVTQYIPYTQVTAQSTGGSFAVPIIAPHNGATLSSVDVILTVGTAHTGVPASLPTIQITRVGTTGTVVNLSSTGTQVFPTPGSGAAYYNGGVAQDFIYTCNQNNVIDTANYCYYIIVNNESGANSQNFTAYGPLLLNYTNITSSQWSS